MPHKHYTESIVYEIELASRVCHEALKRWFEKYAINDISAEEYGVLDTINCNKDLSQIELANMILRGKAHTGKFLDSLEAKGYITRKYDMKNSRMVKIPVITDKGMEIYKQVNTKLTKAINVCYEIYPLEQVKKLRNDLRYFREKLTEIASIKFN